MAAIVTRGLTRKFDGLTAVNSVSLEVREGELFGLLGPNGAGKTTFLHMLCTILPPTAGTAKINGLDIREKPDETRRAIGIVFQDPSLDGRLTARENLDFHGRIYGMPGEVRERRIEEVLELVELEKRADSLVDTYSGGMRRRLEVARGLMHHPKVLFLDEPTLGLDPQTRRHIWDYIQKLREEKITIVFTTHYMDEADYLCDRVAIIDRGKILVVGEPEKLKDKLGGDVVSMEVPQPEKYVGAIRRERGVRDVKVVGGKLNLSVTGGAKHIPRLLKAVERIGGDARSVELHRPTLEDVFMHYTGRKIRDEQGGAGEGIRIRARAWMRR